MDCSIESLSYSISYNGTIIPKNPLTDIGGFKQPNNYETQILILLQKALIQVSQNSELLRGTLLPSTKKDEIKPVIEIGSVEFPWTGTDVYYTVKKDPATGPLIIIFLCTCAYSVAVFCHYTLNNERDGQLRVSMKIMGLTDFSYWLSWIITWTFYNAVANFIVVVVGYVSRLDMFINSNPLVIYLALLLYTESLIFSVMWTCTLIRNNALTNICSTLTLVAILSFSLLFADFLAFRSKNAEVCVAVLVNRSSALFLKAIPTYNFGMVLSSVYFATSPVLKPGSDKWQPGRGYFFSDLFNSNLYGDVMKTFDGERYERFEVYPAIWNLVLLALSCPVFFILTWIFDNILPCEYIYYSPLIEFQLIPLIAY